MYIIKKIKRVFFSHSARISFTVQNAYFSVLWVQGRWRWVASNKFGSFRVEPWYTTSSDICHQYQVSILFGGRSLYKDVYQISCEFFPKLNSCSLCKSPNCCWWWLNIVKQKELGSVLIDISSNWSLIDFYACWPDGQIGISIINRYFFKGYFSLIPVAFSKWKGRDGGVALFR